MSTRARRRRALLRLARALGGTALGLALALGVGEAYARWRWPSPPAAPDATLPESLTAGCATTHPTRGWAMRPNKCGADGRGLRTLPADAPADARVVLLVGDSVGEKEWAAVLPVALGARVGAPVKIRSAAVSGYNTCQLAKTLAETLRPERPDAVLVQTCPNDLVGSVAVLPAGPWSALVQTHDGWWRVPRLVLDSRLGQVALVEAGLRAAAPHRGTLGAAAARCTADIARRVAEAGVPAAVLHFPGLVDRSDPSPEAERLRRDEADVQAAWAAAPLPRLDGRALLEPRGRLSSLATGATDLLHPRPGTGVQIAEAIAGPLAEAWGWAPPAAPSAPAAPRASGP